MAPQLTWHFSQKQTAKDNPVVVLIHHYGGTQDQFTRHVSLLNELGFDVVTFDLDWHRHGARKFYFKFLRDVWAGEVQAASLEILKERQIIILSFSGLSFCVLDALAEIMPDHKEKIRALMFDSGPFEEHPQCVRNMMLYYYGIKNAFLRETIARFLLLIWGPATSEKTQMSFKKIFESKPEIPILSIQGIHDNVIPNKYVHECFVKAAPQNLTEVIFMRGGHLTALKEEPELYKATLQKFLSPL